MRIGLIAMSGIRVCDTELLRLGLTLPGFVERSKTIAALPSLGLLTLAGMTPAKHQVQYIEVPELRQLGELPAGFDLVAISSYSAQIDEAYDLARRYKAAGIPSVIGGPHVSALPEEAEAYCDAVVIGEGEPCWSDVIEDAEHGRLQPRSWRARSRLELHARRHRRQRFQPGRLGDHLVPGQPGHAQRNASPHGQHHLRVWAQQRRAGGHDHPLRRQ